MVFACADALLYKMPATATMRVQLLAGCALAERLPAKATLQVQLQARATDEEEMP